MRFLEFVSSEKIKTEVKKKVGIPVEALALTFVFTTALFCVNSQAETGPSVNSQTQAGAMLASSGWDDQPSWAAPANGNTNSGYNSPSTSRKKISQDNTNLSPFSPGSNNVALDVGQVFLMGDLGNKYSDSIGEQVHYTYGVSDLFGFDSSLGYSSHSDGDFSMVTALTGIRLNLSYYDKIVPYAIGGLGFYKPTYTITGTNGMDTTASTVLFGLHVGAGVDLELTRNLFFGAALTLHDVFGSVQQVNNQTLAMGGSFASFLIHAGVTF
jgi:opacity protein-like surface antigen